MRAGRAPPGLPRAAARLAEGRSLHTSEALLCLVEKRTRQCYLKRSWLFPVSGRFAPVDEEGSGSRGYIVRRLLKSFVIFPTKLQALEVFILSCTNTSRRSCRRPGDPAPRAARRVRSPSGGLGPDVRCRCRKWGGTSKMVFSLPSMDACPQIASAAVNKKKFHFQQKHVHNRRRILGFQTKPNLTNING